jgi:phosphoribosyl 1,2-cyclic phosphodiesterase
MAIEEQSDMTRLIFLGTGGGRFATIYQMRATAGIYIDDGVRMHIDPGPGALVHLHRAGIDPTLTDAILVSHCHPDHYTDAEILIEAMTQGGSKKRGTVLGSKSVFEGVKDFSPAISKYHSRLVEHIVTMVPRTRVKVDTVAIEATPSAHSDETAVGFRIFTSNGVISYVSDTALMPEVIQAHRMARVLIIACTRPQRSRIPHHLATEDAAEIVKAIKPELAVLTHFGLRMLRYDPDKEAEWIQTTTGIRTVAAKDGLILDIGTEIKLSMVEPKKIEPKWSEWAERA